MELSGLYRHARACNIVDLPQPFTPNMAVTGFSPNEISTLCSPFNRLKKTLSNDCGITGIPASLFF